MARQKPTYKEGVVYLKHKLTGRLYPYEATLAKHPDIEPVVPNDTGAKEEETPEQDSTD